MGRRQPPGVAGVLVAAAALLAVHLLWPVPSGVLVQGALVGGLTALVSLGLALVYRADRIVNFAQGDLGALPASLAVLLIVSSGLNYFVALAAGLAAAVAVGLVVDVVVVRRFARSARLVLTVATLGLSQVLAAGGLLLPGWFRVRIPPQNAPAPFHAALTVGGVTFRGNDLLAMGAVPVCLAGLAWFLGRTSVGLAIRAGADDPDRAALLGLPTRSLRTLVWVLATALSTIALFLRAGVVGLPIGTVLGPDILLRALAAAVVGRMERLVTITVAAVGLGIVEQSIVRNTGQTAYVAPVLFLVIVGALLLDRRRPQARRVGDPAGSMAVREARPLPARVRRDPSVRRARVAMGTVVVLAFALAPLVVPDSRLNLMGATALYAVVALSLVVLTGWAGQVSLGQMAFVGLGAAVGGWLTSSAHTDLLVAIAGAGAIGAVVALVLGVPALRLGGLELSVTTLALALMTSEYLLNPRFVHWLPTGRVSRRPLLHLVPIGSEARFYELCLVALVLALAAVQGIRASRSGRALVAVRENPSAAEAMGVPSRSLLLSGFAFSGFLAAGAGAVFVHHQQGLGSSPFAPAESLAALTMVVVGGLGSAAGAVLGAAYVRGADWLLPLRYRILATGTGLLAVLLVLPDGLASLLWRARDLALRQLLPGPGLDGPDPGAVRDPSRGSAAGGVPAASPAARPSALPRSGSDGPGAALEVSAVSAGYGGTGVLRGVDLRVAAGESVALVGTNGAGKSTLLRVIAGALRSDGGEVRLAGAPSSGASAHRLAARHVSLLPGGRGVFPSLTVAENLELARRVARRAGVLDEEAVAAVVERFPVVSERAGVRAGDLSGGQQQILALAMVLAARAPVLLLDELSLGLSPEALAELTPLVAARRASGVAVVVVEQSLEAAAALADRVAVLARGVVAWEGSPDELAAQPALLQAVFFHRDSGAESAMASQVGEPASGAPKPAAPPARDAGRADGKPALSVSGLSVAFGGVRAVDGVDLDVTPGEIIGIVGPNGAGKTTLLDAVSGFVPVEGGRVLVHGTDVAGLAPHRRARFGLARSFQDAWLFPALTVAETVATALERRLPVRDPVAAALHLPEVRRAETWAASRSVELLELLGLTPYAERFVDECSTGTRRIIELATVLAQEADVILLDEPTAGIAQREVEQMGPVLRRLRDEAGVTLVVVEHDLGFLAGLVERVVTMELGRVTADGPVDAVLGDAARR